MHRAAVTLSLVAVLFVGGSVGVTSVRAQGPTEGRTLQVRAERPHFISSAAWFPGGLLLLDLTQERLQWLDGDGRLTPLRELGEMVQRMRPLGTSGDLLVQMANQEWWTLRVAPSGEWALRSRWACPSCSIHSWAALHGEKILGVGEVRLETAAEPIDSTASEALTAPIGSGAQDPEPADDEAEPAWLAGLFWVSSDGPPELAYPLDGSELPLYLMGLEWVASLGNTGYAIVPEPVETRTASGYRYLQIVELPSHHRGHRVVARLPSPMPEVAFFQDRRQMRETLAAVSRQQVPLALLGWEGFLYVVQKNDLGLGIWRIDPATGGMEFLDFASSSDFVTVVPGDEEWAFLHKGPMLSPGQQEVRWVTFYPASGFRR